MAIAVARELPPESERELDDRDLWQGLASHEIGALEALYDRYAGLAYSMAYRIVDDQQTAEDVVQESFHQVWRNASTYQIGRGSLRSWVLGIVHHRAVDVLRRRGARPRTISWSASAHDLPGTNDTWTEVRDRLTTESLQRALLYLSAEQREAIELAFFQGYTHVEVAERLDVPLGTVKGRIRLGLQRLRGILQEQGELGPRGFPSTV